MNCPNCRSYRVGVIAEDRVPCDACKKTISMGYWICKNCDLCFRTANGRILEDSYILKGGMVEETCRDFCNAVLEDGEVEKRMVDEIHHCIRCGSIIVHEKRKNYFCCSDCKFEWEVL